MTLPRNAATIGGDLGLSHDTRALVVSALDPDTRLAVLAVDIVRGTPKKPVSLMDTERRIIEVATTFNTNRVVLDRWQAALLSERLSAQGFLVQQVVSDAANLDRWATWLRRVFATRAIRIPNLPEFIEQLEGLEGEELRRRDRVRFTAHGANRDDAAIALCLSAMRHANHVGSIRMSEISGCLREANGLSSNCYLWGGPYVPCDPLCNKYCAANISTREAHAAHHERTGEWVDLRSFVKRGLIAKNAFVSRRQFRDLWDNGFRG
jgi:hypothetical protein